MSQILAKIIACLIGIAQSEPVHCFITELSALQIIQPHTPLWCTQLIIKVSRSFLIDLQKRLSAVFLLSCLFGILDLRQCDPRPVCQQLDCFRKGVILIIHDKGKYITARSAAEAVIHLFPGADGKGG